MKKKRNLITYLLSCLIICGLASQAFAGSIVAWGRNDEGECDVPSPNAGFVAISASGGFHSLGLKNDGSIVAWGANDLGQCNIPSPNTDFIAISAGGHQSLALKNDSSIVAWGNNWYGQCDIPSPNTGFIAISSGWFHSLALQSDGTIVGWGCNITYHEGRYVWGGQAIPPDGNNYIAISAGGDHSLALRSDGTIVGWGPNWYGQATPPDGNNFIAISAGHQVSLGLKTDGSIVAFGRNIFGECNVPSPNTGFVAIGAGCGHCLGLKQDGSIVVWGRNDFGQWNVPSPNTGFIDISAGYTHSLALTGGPVADAGDNIQIASAEQASTIIYGTATDADGDLLEYRWLEGEQVLLNWSAVGSGGEAYLDLATLPYFSIGNHTLTLEVREVGIGGLSASDEMVLTIENSPPVVQAAPKHQVIEVGVDPIVVVGDAGDFDGDTLVYKWLDESNNVLASGTVATTPGGEPVTIPDLDVPAGDTRFPVGEHTVRLQVSDGINEPVTDSVSVEVTDTTAPSLSPVPSVTILWPPNHKLIPVTIWANAFDNGGGDIVLSVTVQSSEPADAIGDGNTEIDYYIDSVNNETGVIELRLRSERSGKGGGRVYTITITATDANQNQSQAVVQIRAPHDKSKK